MDFNVWIPSYNRWTNSTRVSKNNVPMKMSWAAAKKEADELNYYCDPSKPNFEVRELLPDGSPGNTYLNDPGSGCSNGSCCGGGCVGGCDKKDGCNSPAAAVSSKQSSGCKCTKCHEWYEYAVPVANFVCYGCKH